MRNLARLTNAANRIAAWQEWNELARQYPDLAQNYAPPPDAGWRIIDRQSNRLRTAAAERQSQMTTETTLNPLQAEYLALSRREAKERDEAIGASLIRYPSYVPEWCDGDEPCYACKSQITGFIYTGSTSRAAFARLLEAEELWLRHNAPQHPDIVFTEVEQ